MMRSLSLAALAVCFSGCPDPVDQAAKKRIFSSEDPPQAVAAAKETLPPEDVASSPAIARRVLGMSAAEATERLGPHAYLATVTWDWSAGARSVRLKETRELLAGPGGISGDFLARVSNSNDQGLEVIRVGGKVYARSTYGKDGAGRFRERRRDRGIAERMRDEAFSAVRDFDQLFRGRLALSAKGTQTVDGRVCWRYELSLAPPAAEAPRALPPLPAPAGGADETTLRRRAFFELREPKTLQGEVLVDAETSVVVKASMNGRIGVASDAGDAELRVALEAALSNVGRSPTLEVPPDFLPDEDKPQGIAAALKRFGIERGDGGTVLQPPADVEPTPEDGDDAPELSPAPAPKGAPPPVPAPPPTADRPVDDRPVDDRPTPTPEPKVTPASESESPPSPQTTTGKKKSKAKPKAGARAPAER
ncbi:MAG: hypothetical protein INH41_21900 [Myxococcaceae bacterium]|nr:hypothetical protein [Myxococcaceae bacterium]MCA3015050.1 hypothetical protein [Myxococcaceae bacterium]